MHVLGWRINRKCVGGTYACTCNPEKGHNSLELVNNFLHKSSRCMNAWMLLMVNKQGMTLLGYRCSCCYLDRDGCVKLCSHFCCDSCIVHVLCPPDEQVIYVCELCFVPSLQHTWDACLSWCCSRIFACMSAKLFVTNQKNISISPESETDHYSSRVMCIVLTRHRVCVLTVAPSSADTCYCVDVTRGYDSCV